MLTEPLPREVARELDIRGLNGVPVLLVTSADLELDGQRRRQWVVVTRDRVSVVAEGSDPTRTTDGESISPHVVRSITVQDIELFRAHNALGSGFLQAFEKGVWIDLVRFSNGLASRFHKVAKKLEDLRTTGQLEVAEDEQVDETRCPQCEWKLASPSDLCPRCVPRKAIVGRLLQMLWPQWPSALAMCGLMLVGVAAELAPPKLQQYLVDQILSQGATTPGSRELLLALLVVVLGLACARIVLGLVGYFKGILATRVGVALTSDLRARMVEKLQTLGVAYYDRHQVGSLTSRVAYDSEVIHSLLHQITGGFLLQIVQVVAVGVMLFTLNPKLALFMLIPTPLVIGGSWFFWRRIYPKHYRYWDSSSKQAGTLSGMLSGIRVVKAFAQEEREYERFRKFSDYLRRSRITVEEATAGFSAAMQLIFSLGGLIVWYVGGRDVLAGEMSLGSLMAFLAYVAMFYAPLATLSQLTTWLTSFMTGCQRVFELLDTPVETVEPTKPESWAAPRGEIAFENVTFGYDRHHPVLRQVSFQIEPGQTIGIVGRSGSGKTTLVNLISRFYDVQEGRILVDGIDVRNVAKSALRRHVGIVLQEPFLFRGTIWDNLVYGEPNATRDAALTAAKAAQAHDFILRSPLAYDTWLGERGAGLSGGERQRLSIARALLYNPRILILDEATSSVDTESEQAIQQALKVLARGRTTIAIAHRLTTLRDAHRIFVFDQGRLTEQGTHAELMTHDGHYAKLVRIQTQLSSDSSVDHVLARAAEPVPEQTAPVPSRQNLAPSTDDDSHLDDYRPYYFHPATTLLRSDPHGGLEVQDPTVGLHRGVFAVRLFPASDPDHYISLRIWDRDGREQELGLIRGLDDWSSDDQQLLRAALSRRYLLRTIQAIRAIRVEYGHLRLDVETSEGSEQLTMRWSQNQVQDFGGHGKLLIDTEDNRYLVPNVEELPRRDRDLFQRYVYW